MLAKSIFDIISVKAFVKEMVDQVNREDLRKFTHVGGDVYIPIFLGAFNDIGDRLVDDVPRAKQYHDPVSDKTYDEDPGPEYYAAKEAALNEFHKLLAPSTDLFNEHTPDADIEIQDDSGNDGFGVMVVFDATKCAWLVKQGVEPKKLEESYMKKLIESASEVELYANPFDGSAHGFQFNSKEDFDKKYEAHKPVEEYEIDFVDGPSEEAELFAQLHGKISMANLELYFDEILPLDELEKAGLFHGLETGFDLEDALRKAQNGEFAVSEGNLEAYAENYIQDTVARSKENEFLLRYFDYKQFANDLKLSGDMNEFEFAGKTWVANNNA